MTTEVVIGLACEGVAVLLVLIALAFMTHAKRLIERSTAWKESIAEFIETHPQPTAEQRASVAAGSADSLLMYANSMMWAGASRVLVIQGVVLLLVGTLAKPVWAPNFWDDSRRVKGRGA